MKINEAFVVETDDALIADDVKLHQRPFHVAMAWMRTQGIGGDILDDAIWTPLMEIYRKLYPSGDFRMPALLEGGVALRDRMFRVRINVGYGMASFDPADCIDISRDELEVIFLRYPDQGWRAIYGVANLWDIAYAIDDLARNGNTPAGMLLKNARSSVAATARILIGALDVDGAVQSACLSAELAMKGALAVRGWDEKRYKGLSHNLRRISDALISEVPTDNDGRLADACAKFPDYVGTRYASHGMTRVELMALAMRAQYVAADAVRRVSDRNVGGMMEADERNPAREIP